MADSHDPRKHTLYLYKQEDFVSEEYETRAECIADATEAARGHPREPVTIYASTEVMTIEAVTTRTVYPWYPPAPEPPPAAYEMMDPPPGACDREVV